MPLKNGLPYCVNHPEVPLARNREFLALTAFSQSEKGNVFNSSSGVPVVFFYCPTCGYVEMYAAALTQNWRDVAEGKHGLTTIRLDAFETDVLEALTRRDGPFADASVTPHVKVDGHKRRFELDAVVRTETAVYAVEIKAVTSVARALDAARSIADKATEYAFERQKPVSPLLIVPAGATVPDQFGIVPVLKFDTAGRQFINVERVLAKTKDVAG